LVAELSGAVGVELKMHSVVKDWV